MGRGRLEQIPFVAVEIFEDGDGAVGLTAGRFEKADALRDHGRMVARKVVSVKKKKNAAASLFVDAGGLFRCCRAGEQKGCAVRIRWTDDDPTFAGARVGVLNKGEAEFLREERDGFVVVADEVRHLSNRLRA